MQNHCVQNLAINLVMATLIFVSVSHAQLDTTLQTQSDTTIQAKPETTVQAKPDSVIQLDKIHLRDGTVLEGSVKVIKTDIVEFYDRETKLNYEFKKSDIRVIVLSSGKAITFLDEPMPKNQQPQPPVVQPTIIEKDHGAPVGLVILATVGVVLVVLLVVGAAAS